MTPIVFWLNLRGGYKGRVHAAIGPWETACGMTRDFLATAPTVAPVSCLRCLAATGQTGELLGDER